MCEEHYKVGIVCAVGTMAVETLLSDSNIQPPLGLGTEFRSEKIPRNRLGMVSVIPRKKGLIPNFPEEPVPKLGTQRNGAEFREKMKFYGTV